MTGGTPYYLTTPIYYVNDAPHLGHAYTTVAADALARFMRLDGRRVHFLTGTDEHGQKVEKSAQAAGLAPQAFCDRVSQNFRDMTRLMNVSNDDFIRTTEPRHIRSCQALWRAVAARKSPKGRDNIYLGKYAGWYAVRDEAFYGEDEIAIGADGKRRAPSGAEVEWVEEPSYFFRLSDWADWLLAHFERNPESIAPAARRNEVISFVRGGLHDLSISRTSFTWGVPVPDDPKHIMYVWFDALTNYITAVGYPDDAARFEAFWPADLHMVGKDIIRFHGVYWPAFLAAADLKPAKRVFGHGWWTVEGEKMSKSLGNFIPPDILVDKYGVDAVRYFILRELPFGSDGDFSHRAMVNRINGDLANGLGNLAQRVLTLVQRNCAGKVPKAGPFTNDDSYFNQDVRELRNEVAKHFKEQAFHRALEAIWDVIAKANRYIDEQAPWTLRKSDPGRMETVLYCLAEALRQVAILVQPVVPGAADKLLGLLGIGRDTERRNFHALAHALESGQSLPPPEAIFPRYVEA
jgi:methionyl-tRNA synthetase